MKKTQQVSILHFWNSYSCQCIMTVKGEFIENHSHRLEHTGTLAQFAEEYQKLWYMCNTLVWCGCYPMWKYLSTVIKQRFRLIVFLFTFRDFCFHNFFFLSFFFCLSFHVIGGLLYSFDSSIHLLFIRSEWCYKSSVCYSTVGFDSHLGIGFIDFSVDLITDKIERAFYIINTMPIIHYAYCYWQYQKDV